MQTNNILKDKLYTQEDMKTLADQMESLFSGQKAAVYLIPTGGVNDWNDHRDIFTNRNSRSRNVHYDEQILTFGPYDVNIRKSGPAISNPEEIKVRGCESVVIYDDVIKRGNTISEAAYFLLVNSEMLGFSPSFALYVAGKIDKAGIANLTAIRGYEEWVGLREFLERGAKEDERLNFIYSELKKKNLLDKISLKSPPSSTILPTEELPIKITTPDKNEKNK
jgi:hypothetical protein